MENIYIVFVEYDNKVAKISPIKCSFKNIITSSINSLKKKDIYYYDESNVTKFDKNTFNNLIELIENKNNELGRNNELGEKSIVSSPTISFIIITSEDSSRNKPPCYVINCDIKSEPHESIGNFTHINKNITNLISNLIFNINYNKKLQPQTPQAQAQAQHTHEKEPTPISAFPFLNS
jgi:hypothetical protein